MAERFYMDFQNFWQLVERHPWIVRVVLIGRTWEKIDSEYGRYPAAFGEFFAPSTIEREIEYIAFRPWNTLDKGAVPSSAHRRTKTDFTVDTGVDVNYECYWHKHKAMPTELPFRRCISSIAERGRLDEENMIGTLTVFQMIEYVENQGGVVDCIVKEKFGHIERFKTYGQNPVENLVNRLRSEERRISSYDIYLPS